MKSKEEILFPLHTHCDEELEMIYTHEDTIKAMDEYAEQEVKSNAKALILIILSSIGKSYLYKDNITIEELISAIKQNNIT